METGYDYLLVRSRLQHRFIRASGILLIITGAVLLTAATAYFAYAYKARSDLDRLNFSVAAPQGWAVSVPGLSGPLTAAQGRSEAISPLTLGSVTAAGTTGVAEPVQNGNPVVPALREGVAGVGEAAQSSQPITAEEPVSLVSPSAIAAQRLYPGEAIEATYWGNPLEYEPSSYIEATLIQGFTPVLPDEAPPIGTLPAPTRILIPSIGVDSEVTGLQILDLGDSRAYETPKHVVGYIPEYANPGENGSTWFFGHLESPIAGEGNVFYNLPKIPDLLRKGRDVYTIVESGGTSYLYRIIETRVVQQDDIKLYDTGGPTIHLVVCVPRFVYDHRLIVTGELVGIRT